MLRLVIALQKMEEMSDFEECTDDLDYMVQHDVPAWFSNATILIN